MQDAVDVRFSKSELTSLVKTKGTCVTLAKKTRVVFLLPSQLSDIKTGIKENLDSHLLKYDYETKAIIIGYEKIKILSKYGSICYGYSKIALRIEASFYLFKPTVGSNLQGVVCKQSGHHLGCLVHKGFNVSIPLGEDDGCGWDYSIGQDVKFTIIKLDLTSGPLPYIIGQLCVDGVERGVVSAGGEGVVSETPTRWQSEEEQEQKPPEAVVDGGRDTLINRLLKTVEMSLGEQEAPPPVSPKKVKQKKAEPEKPASEDDAGSIIHRLMEMSRREVLGSPKARKRKSDGGPVMAMKKEVPWSPGAGEKCTLPESRGLVQSPPVGKAKLRVATPDSLQKTEPALPLKVKKKSSPTIKTETKK